MASPASSITRQALSVIDTVRVAGATDDDYAQARLELVALNANNPYFFNDFPHLVKWYCRVVAAKRSDRTRSAFFRLSAGDGAVGSMAARDEPREFSDAMRQKLLDALGFLTPGEYALIDLLYFQELSATETGRRLFAGECQTPAGYCLRVKRLLPPIMDKLRKLLPPEI